MTKKEMLYMELRQDIMSGTYKPGELLISENKICEKYNVSREPVRRALTSLQDKGYITSHQGKGYIINPPEFYLNSTVASLSIETGGIYKTKILSFEKIDNFIDEIIGDKIFHYVRLIETKSNRIYEEGYISSEIYKDFSMNFCKGSISSYFNKNINFPITHERKELSSVIIKKNHPINENIDKPIKNSIQTTHYVYSGETVLQISIQIKYDSKIVILSRI